MPELLANESVRWTIGTVITLLIGVAAIFVPYYLNRERKHLWYQVFVYPVIEERFADRITLLFDGDPVPNVYATIIRLRYQGTDPIVEDDYRTPVTFSFGKAEILSAELVDTAPPGINAAVKSEDVGRIVFEPVALNDGNRLLARVLSTTGEEPGIEGHIVGIKEFRDLRSKRDWSDTAFLVGMVGIVLGIFTFFAGFLIG